MLRFGLVALVVAFVVAINPTLREKALPYLQPALDPAYEWLAQGRLEDITKQMEAQAAVGQPLPTGETLDDFLRERYSNEDAARDPWGTPYFLRESRDRVIAGSAGRDGEVGTEDDILSDPVYRGGR